MSVPYHRLFRVHPRYRWWRPLVALAIMLGFWIATQIVISIVVLAVVIGKGGATGAEAFTKALQSDALDSSKPGVLVITLVSLVVLLPAIIVSVRMARLGPFGQLSSVRLRLRWRWMGQLLLPLLVFGIVTVGVQAVGIPGLEAGYFVWRDGGFHANTALVGHSTVSLDTAILAIVLVVVLVPFQAAAEEYIFRGFIIQSVGSWIPWRKVSLVVGWFVSTICFAAAHVPNGYNGWAILDVGSFGFVSALLLWRTGGLEAGILAHAINNVGIFVLQAPGWSAINPNDGNESPGQLIYTVVTLAIYAAGVDLMARWMKLERRRPGYESLRVVGPAPAWIESVSTVGATDASDDTAWERVPAAPAPAAEASHAPVDNGGGVGPRP